ncbi:hypothetical protein GJU40_13270 [Bacillus lacus]|uniref:Family 2 glycosyl transferase n=1 Tax=Metabacillus lacus TaxID=1983721 RepID=A0A7X2J0C6_9BACI|nr:hypothetical protein [Metabacillus lacus]MRX73113.1 hypothetical protein [Metabacillus lacus]
MSKKTAVAAGITLAAAIITAPFWTWTMKDSKTADVLIVNYTVPDTSFREHRGLTWLLNNLKITKGDGKRYKEEDYSGYAPAMEGTETVKKLPEDLSQYEYIYIVDTYGVFESDLEGDTLSDGSRSELVYGGMEEEDLLRIEDAMKRNGSTLIAEFNTFASPTKPEVKERFYNLLNLRWSGWTGRFFQELNSSEVPLWLKENYEKATGEAYSLKGSGLVFVNEGDEVIVLNDDELNGAPVMFSFTERGSEELNLGGSVQYSYWFDVVQAEDSSEILAEYTLNIDDKGEKKLAEAGLPLKFPAVIHHSSPFYSSYYFAGDFVDEPSIPRFYQAQGIMEWKKLSSSDKRGRTDGFFWKAYAPLMKAILSADRNEEAVSAPVHKNSEIFKDGSTSMIGKTGSDYIQIYKDGEWEDLLIKGVNMGIAKPGTFPGETAISKGEYARWFKQISEMNANSIRIYTIHPPEFYEALYEHNQDAEKPLYLFHGVWVNEEVLVEKANAFDTEVTNEFKDEIKRVVDLVHGEAALPKRPGHAGGTYAYDLSPYLLGWVIGVEWDPDAAESTNLSNPDKGSYQGKYIRTEEGAEPFEAWLAEMLDYTVGYESDTYQWQHPASFTNWVTTDLLTHPSEPSEKEDKVTINPNHISATENFKAGLFASYHIYPYYPDFLNYEKKYTEYVDHRGQKNNYAGYLNDMKSVHSMPLLVAEFGIPASRGMTHRNVYGLNQGYHSEQEQGSMVARLFEDITVEKMAGGMVFSWQDEWFKRTWNTMDYDNPERRPFWNNMQINEQHFGLLSFDPQTEDTLIKVDGDTEDWEARKEKPVFQNGKGLIQDIYLSSDESSLNIRLDMEQNQWLQNEYDFYILLDTIKGQGQSAIPGIEGTVGSGIDFAAQLKGEENSRLLIDSYYDTFYYDYGHVKKMIPSVNNADKKNNGIYHPIRLTLNKALTINNEEGKIDLPFDSYETGRLQMGNGNPSSKNYNSLTDFAVNKENGIIELKLQWMLLNFKDPSQREMMGDIWKDGIEASAKADGIRVAVVAAEKGSSLPIETLPENLEEDEWLFYTWDTWDEPLYHERLKVSFDIMKQAYAEITIK